MCGGDKKVGSFGTFSNDGTGWDCYLTKRKFLFDVGDMFTGRMSMGQGCDPGPPKKWLASPSKSSTEHQIRQALILTPSTYR